MDGSAFWIFIQILDRQEQRALHDKKVAFALRPLNLAMNRPSRNEWDRYFRSIGLPDERIVLYMNYVSSMYKKKMPPVFEFHHLAKLLGRDVWYLASVINSPESHYREFSIPKRSGGKRIIEAPYPSLLECQRWINKHILSQVRIHMVAHGFRREKSILTNARQHLNKQCLLKTDLTDFFHAIPQRRVIGVFRKLGYPSNVSFYLSQICCCRNRLPQGAATSPALSNTIAYKMDNRLYKLAKKLRLKYTRYADDIAISGDYISFDLFGTIEKIVEEEGFSINAKKTHLLIGRKKKIITGVSVSGELPRIPKHYKRALRQELHYINKYGIYSHINERRIRDPFYANTLYGKLLFWKWVEPDNVFVNSEIGKIRQLLKEN